MPAALLLAGCAGGGDRGGTARDGGAIAVGASRVPASLDPALASDEHALQLLRLAYTPLLSYRHAAGRDGAELVPGLARSLPEVSDDGLTYVFRLRRGLRYSNGAPLRAGDFERSIRRVRALSSPLATLYAGVRTIDAERSGVIRVTLRRPDPTFEHVLALPSSAPLPRAVAATDLSARPPPGIGPYRIRAVRPGKRVVLVRVRGLRLPGVPAGHVDRIALVRSGPPARQAAAVIAGTLDVMQEAAPTPLLLELRTRYEERYREELGASTVALFADAPRSPLDDEEVRRAIGTALDADKLVRLSSGLLEPTCNVLPAAVPGYRRLDPCPYGDRDEPADLVSAREQVEQADAGGTPVAVRADPDLAAPLTRYVARTLRKIGLDATLGGNARARLRLERIAPPVAHPAPFLVPFTRRTFDSQLSEAVADGVRPSEGEEAVDAWAAADELIVTEGYAAPLGSERRPGFFSERIDVENCARFHPLFGIDLSSLCLK